MKFTDKTNQDFYDEVLQKLIVDKFEYKNRILNKLKYNYEEIENNEYTELLKFCEDIAELYIYKKMLKNGNEEVNIYINEIISKLKEVSKNKNTENVLNEEKRNIIKLILEEDFEKTEYYNLIQVALNLKDVFRYSTLTTVVPENVLFHQYVMAITCQIVADYMIFKGENIDKYNLLYKTLFHDFGEYKGNEIVAQIKIYNDDTKRMFAEMEEKDEEELEELIGEDLYEIIKDYKKGVEGYIGDIIDKILGIMKIDIEVCYMNNLTYIKALCSLYQKRFEKFKNLERIEAIKDKKFLLKLLKESYIYIKENVINKDTHILEQYFTIEEIEGFKTELEELKNTNI